MHAWFRVGVSCLAATACSPARYAADADAEVEPLLRERTDQVLGDREQRVLQVDAGKKVDPGKKDASPPTQEVSTGAPIDLDGALRVAFAKNRDFQSQRENIYLRGLDTTATDFAFGPQLSASINSSWRRPEGGPDATDVTSTARASQILPSGGTVALTGTLGARDWTNSYGIALEQPLLRGFGYEVSHEQLTQAHRSLVYAIREFELFRQDLSIRIVTAFFDLVAQQRTLGNDEQNWQQAVFDREKAEALFQVDRVKEEDVFRARRREIEAEDALIGARASYRRAVDEFKLLLGLDTSAVLGIADQEPPFQVVDIDADSAVRAAQHNRLDLQSRREQVEDAERGVRLARNGLLPDLGVSVDAGRDDPLGRDGAGAWSAAASVSAEIPLQRTRERNAYRSAQVAYDRAQRDYALTLEQLELDIRDQLRQLASIEQRVALQIEQITQQERAVAITQFKFEQGELENRDLLEARQSLVDARNALIRLKANHFIQRLRLLRDVGLLFVSEDGQWR